MFLIGNIAHRFVKLPAKYARTGIFRDDWLDAGINMRDREYLSDAVFMVTWHFCMSEFHDGLAVQTFRSADCGFGPGQVIRLKAYHHHDPQC